MQTLNEELDRMKTLMGVDEDVFCEQHFYEYVFKKPYNKLLTEEKALILEFGILDVASLVKAFLTSHRGAELATTLGKLLYKHLGIDKNLDGINDKCQSEDQCNKLKIQLISEALQKVHEWIIRMVSYVSAMVKYKKLKPTEEEINSSTDLAKKFFTAVIIACLGYYMNRVGVEIADGHYFSAILPALGSVIKISELSKKFEHAVHDINSSVASA